MGVTTDYGCVDDAAPASSKAKRLKDLPLPPHTLALYGSATKIEAMKMDGAVRTADASHAMLMVHGSWSRNKNPART